MLIKLTLIISKISKVSSPKPKSNPYVIAIDGPAGSGKGTVAKLVSQKLNFHYLDSGAIYRVIAYAALQKNIESQAIDRLVQMVKTLNIEFIEDKILLNTINISNLIRTESVSKFTSEIAVHPPVRKSILDFQKSFFKSPGLVAEGRDMTTIVFPNAKVKIYLNASSEERINRRYKQLILKGNGVNIADLTRDIEIRDKRDKERKVSPLKIAFDAHVLETDNLTIDQTVAKILQFI